MENSKVTELTYLKEASANNNAFLKNMIQIFLDQTPVLISELIKKSQAEDWTEFRKIMHKVKPTFTMMGIRRLEEIVHKIDAAVKQGIERENLPSLITDMEKICQLAYAELKDELKVL
ncbi:MAG: Hpt domain-containing protein [Cytophagaceae bacterium]